jgi:hypothetical protein
MPSDLAAAIEHGEWEHRARGLKTEPAVDFGLPMLSGVGIAVYQMVESSP